MPWVRFDDNTPEDEGIDSLSDGALRLWFNAICFAARNLTDGFIPAKRIPRLAPNYRPSHMAELVEAGKWHTEEGGIRIHAYLTYQDSAEQVRRNREAARLRMQGKRSPDVRANIPRTGARSSPEPPPEHTANIGGSSPVGSHSLSSPLLLVDKSSSSSESVRAPDGDEDDEDSSFRRACRLIAERRLARRPAPPDYPERWLAKVSADVAAQYAEHRGAGPFGASPEQLADLLERPAMAVTTAPELAMARRNDARRDRPCATCEGDGGYDTAGGWTRCEACQGVGVGA